MPRPCVVEAHARSYKRTFRRFADATALRRGGSRSRLQKNVHEICGCHGLASWRLTLAATKERSGDLRMPRPCAVEAHARGYKRTFMRFADATALRRGGSRSQLQKNVQEICGCHGLAPWRLTLAATKERSGDLRMPRPCAVEAHARSYKRTFREICGCHGLAPWRLTLAATKERSGDLRMPRPCAVEAHARGYKKTFRRFADATALRRGGSRSQ